MKKFTLLFTCLLLSAATFAQSIPNNGFETWSTVSGQTYDNPDGWGTSNDILVPAGGNANTFKDTNEKNSGTGSAKLQTSLLSLFGGAVNLNITGALVSGTISYNTTSNEVSFGGGFPYTSRPGALTGYYKYTPVGSDSYSIAVVLWKWNIVDMKRDTIAVGASVNGTAQSTFKKFEVTLHYSSLEIPDSAMVIGLSTAAFIGSAAGSTLWLDDLSFDYGAGINSVGKEVSISSFPNPAQNTIYINAIPGQFKEAKIFDITGKLITTETVNGNAVNVSTLANGNYVMILNDSKNKTFKSMISVNR